MLNSLLFKTAITVANPISFVVQFLTNTGAIRIPVALTGHRTAENSATGREDPRSVTRNEAAVSSRTWMVLNCGPARTARLWLARDSPCNARRRSSGARRERGELITHAVSAAQHCNWDCERGPGPDICTLDNTMRQHTAGPSFEPPTLPSKHLWGKKSI